MRGSSIPNETRLENVRIQQLYQLSGSRACCPARRDSTKRRGIQKACRTQSQEARAEAKGQAPGLGPRGRFPLEWDLLRFARRLFCLASQLSIGEALANDLANEITKSIPVRHRKSIIKSERLLVHIHTETDGTAPR
jgi:hypothetical protein